MVTRARGGKGGRAGEEGEEGEEELLFNGFMFPASARWKEFWRYFTPTGVYVILLNCKLKNDQDGLQKEMDTKQDQRKMG